mgnify:CR=1 FL=1
MKKVFITLFLIFSLFSLVSITRGQTEVSLNMLDVYSTPSGNVEMIISVLNGQGTPIKGLTKANFKLDVEGKKIKEFSLEPVSSAKNPLSIILGMDVSGSMKGNPIKEAKKAASVFLDQLDREDFVALMAFGKGVHFLTEFTKKKHEVREELKKLKAIEMWTWLYQATYEALIKASKTAPTSRVAVVILTDGKDEGSPITKEKVISKVEGAGIPVYTLGFGPKAQVEYLRLVATLSNGYFLFTPKADELSGLYNMVLKQLKNQYLLTFHFPKPAGEYASTLRLSYRGKVSTARKVFLHTVIGKERRWWEYWLKQPTFWGALALVVISMLAVGYWKWKIWPKRSKEEVEEPVRMMLKGKIHPIRSSSTKYDKESGTVVLSREGNVGLQIGMLSFALVDEKSNKKIDEIIITRHDEKVSRFFLKDNAYLLLSDRTVSRPNEERKGHARIFLDTKTNRYQIEDLGSAGGTELNETIILGSGEKEFLKDGDQIKVGSTMISFYEK